MRDPEQPTGEERAFAVLPVVQEPDESRHAGKRQRPQPKGRITERRHQSEHKGAPVGMPIDKVGNAIHCHAC